jgi:hypothetical protein
MLVWSGPSAGAASAATAHARLADAKAAAARWQKDAALVSVTALQAADDGTAPRNAAGWVYTFHSRSAKRWAGFHAGPGGMERVDLPAGLTEPVPGSFVDSDRVLAEIRKHGFRKQGDTLLVLMFLRDPSLKPGVYWCGASAADVSSERGMRGYCVDPASGRFVARMAGQPAAGAEAGTRSREAKPPATGGGLASVDPAQCGGYSAADAAAILGVPASGVSRRAQRVDERAWTCSFASGKGGPQVVFRIEVARSAAEAAAEMERYRKRLHDEYSDLMGLGDEGVWTEVDRSVTYRKQNVTIRVQQPPDKLAQLKVAKTILDRN